MKGRGRNGPRSLAVTTRTTPGARRAASVRSAVTRAWACGLRRNARCARPGSLRSSTYCPRPVMSFGSSVRLSGRPTYGPESISLIGSSDHRVAQLADGLDPELHRVPGLQEQSAGHADA